MERILNKINAMDEKALEVLMSLVLGGAILLALVGWWVWTTHHQQALIANGQCEVGVVRWVDQPPLVHYNADGTISWMQARDPVLKEWWSCEDGTSFWRPARPGVRP